MSQPDLLTRLREARPIAPAELREHVRLIASRAGEAAPSPPRRRIDWRRVFVVAVPVAAAAVAAVVLLPGGGSRNATIPETLPPIAKSATPGAVAAGTGTAQAAAPAERAALPAPNPQRPQLYTASLQLRVPDTQAVSDDTKQAVTIARSLGGYPSALNVDASGKTGYATIVLRIPKANVQSAVTRLSALGTIVGESVSIKDLGAQVDSTTRKIARLKHSLATWQALPPSAEAQKHIDALTAQIAKLRLGKAATLRTASYATVDLQLTTRPAPVVRQAGHGPLHGLAVAFRWAWIGGAYLLALGTPVAVLAGLGWLLARSIRRRREESLLSRS